MRNRPPPQQDVRWRGLQQSQYSESHDKESTVNNLPDQPLPATTATSSTTAFSTTASFSTTAASISTTTTTAEPYVSAAQRRPYPVKPSTPKAATAFSLFSDPDAFNLTTIYKRTHYLSSSLRGKIWWDVNGDGKRGDYANATLNDMEYDYGVPNVGNIYLVTCDDEREAKTKSITTSKPFNSRDAAPLRQSLNGEAGLYEFTELRTVPSGRYYVVYKAPRGWRLSGNTLPLGRKMLDTEGYYECVPQGGNGGAYAQMARDKGDFDYGGYCARSIGCVEIGSQAELQEKFENLDLLENTDYFENVIQGDALSHIADYGGKMVAFPTPEVMDVGMSQEPWDLPAKQYADAVVTLTFPVPQVFQSGRKLATKESPLETLLTDVFAEAETFGTSVNRQAMGDVLYSYLKENIGAFSNFDSWNNESASFTFLGVDLFGANITRKKLNQTNFWSNLRRAQVDEDNGDEAIEITYSFTARGSYRPPPHEQLGYFVQDSINADPTKLSRALREEPTLPFEEVESVQSNHLTVGPPAPACHGCVGIQASSIADDTNRMEAWATIPIILISLMIGALVFLFFGRRFWKRHHVVGPDTKREMRTKDFASSDLDITKEKNSIAMAGLGEETTEEGDCSRTSSEKKKKKRIRKKSTNKSALKDKSTRTDASDYSELCSRLHAEDEDSSSSSSSEDESEEARRRRRRKERKSKRESHASIRSDPPSLEDLLRQKKKKKRSSSNRRSRSRD
ncbi:hypothetical protein ACHAWX_001001 [Stephanocyclus meneghinianus]